MTTADHTDEIAATLAKLAALLAERDDDAAKPAEAARVLPARTLLTVEEAAEQLGIGRTSMYRLVSSGEIESVRIGRLRRVPKDAISAYITARLRHVRMPLEN